MGRRSRARSVSFGPDALHRAQAAQGVPFLGVLCSSAYGVVSLMTRLLESRLSLHMAWFRSVTGVNQEFLR